KATDIGSMRRPASSGESPRSAWNESGIRNSIAYMPKVISAAMASEAENCVLPNSSNGTRPRDERRSTAKNAAAPARAVAPAPRRRRAPAERRAPDGGEGEAASRGEGRERARHVERASLGIGALADAPVREHDRRHAQRHDQVEDAAPADRLDEHAAERGA